MVARWFRGTLVGALACSLAIAQDTPPPANPPTPPPAPAPEPTPPPAPAGAPRHRSEAKLGSATIVVEHGQPAWSDERIGQIQQGVPVGAAWRMGSEGITTLEIKGGPVFFGDELVEPGRYGFNLLHSSDTSWAFVAFDPKHEAQSPQMLGDESNKQISGVFVDNAPEIVPALTVDVAATGDSGTCELKWGPLRLTAPMTAVNVGRSDLELNGNPAVATWFRRPLRADADLARPVIAGTIDLEIEGESCSMNVYLMQEGTNVVAVLRNQERERWERENAAMDEQTKRLDALIQQFGSQAEAQVGPVMQQMRRRKAKNEVMLEETVNRPDNLKFVAAAEDVTPGRVACDVFKTRSGLNLEATLGAKKALIRVDEEQFALKPSG